VKSVKVLKGGGGRREQGAKKATGTLFFLGKSRIVGYILHILRDEQVGGIMEDVEGGDV
jgi:hypothetical protein